MMAASAETLAQLQLEAVPEQPNFRESGGYRDESWCRLPNGRALTAGSGLLPKPFLGSRWGGAYERSNPTERSCRHVHVPGPSRDFPVSQGSRPAAGSRNDVDDAEKGHFMAVHKPQAPMS